MDGSPGICVAAQLVLNFIKINTLKPTSLEAAVMTVIDFNTLLDIPDVKIEKTEIDSSGDFLVSVRSLIEGTHCHCCGEKTDTSYGFGHEKKIRHLPIFGKRCYIVIRQPRYKCQNCPGNLITTQEQSWFIKSCSHTIAFEKHIMLSLINSTIEDVSSKESIGQGAVEGILDRHISSEADWEKIKTLSVIGIDEISLRKGHKDFATLVTTRDNNGEIQILAVLKDRKKDTVKNFFLSIPKKLRKTVRFVCSDMYDGFINAAKEVLGRKVKIVIDRFHVAKLYRNSFDSLRKKEMKRLKLELSDNDYCKLKNVMWILRKNIADQTEEDLAKLKLLFKHAPILEMAYLLRNTLTDIFDMDITKQSAKRKITSWIQKVRKSGLKCFDKFIVTLEKLMNEIINYFINRNNSGFVEGLNNKVKVLKRRCYGILNHESLFKRLHLDLHGYKIFSV